VVSTSTGLKADKNSHTYANKYEKESHVFCN